MSWVSVGVSVSARDTLRCLPTAPATAGIKHLGPWPYMRSVPGAPRGQPRQPHVFSAAASFRLAGAYGSPHVILQGLDSESLFWQCACVRACVCA